MRRMIKGDRSLVARDHDFVAHLQDRLLAHAARCLSPPMISGEEGGGFRSIAQVDDVGASGLQAIALVLYLY